MKRTSKQKGAMVALLAIALPVLLGGVGMVIDTGSLYDLRRRVQSAADAAAVAAAQEVRLQNTANVASSARYDASENGFADGETTSVAVHRPPTRGHYKGDSDYVEVVVSAEAPLFFMSALTDREFTVLGRAVAGVAGSSVCTWTLDKTAKHSFNATGTSRVTFTDCGIFVNSNDSQAARTTGSATVTAPSIDVVGNYTGNGFSPAPRSGASQLGDPFAELPMPTVGSCNYTNKKVSGTATLSPGVYCGGLTINAGAKVTLNPGVYVVRGGGITINGTAAVAGDGVTFFNTGGGSYSHDVITINGGASVTLTAPASGATKGMLFFDDRNYGAKGGKKHTLNGGSNVNLSGAMYFANTDLHLAGNFTGDGNKMILAAKNITINGSVDFEKREVDMLPPVLAVARVVE